jgi:phosphopantetheinyl transferase/acyl carrier protein
MALAPEAQTPRTSESESRISEPGSPLDAETVEQILLRLVSERTGYPTEMLDLNLDLEADLGIDSIKRVEILGSFQQELGLNLSGELEELAARRTLQGMIDYLADGRGKSNSQPAAATSAQQGSSPAGEGSLQVSPSDPGDLTGDRGGGAASYPLAGEIVALTAGESAVTKVEISLDAYPFLRDHTLGRRISVTDPQLTGLPIVPLTMSMEMMAEAAAILMPRMRLVAMRDVRAYRWIALDEESVTLELSARRLPAQQAVHVQLREGSTADQRSMASTAPIVEGVMAFAEEYPVPPTARELALADECPSKWSANRLYPDAMFHGPAFQGVQSLDRVGQDGAEATLEALPLKDLFASGDPDLLQTDLVLLDQPGQVVGFWAMQQLEESRLVFPFHLEALHLYGPPLPPRERLRCLARIELIGSEQTRSDLDIVGPDGSMWATLAGWQDRRFDVPWSFFEFQLKPRDVMLGRPWPTPVVRSIGLDAYLLSADDFPDGFFNAYGGIWRRVLAHLVLSRRERELWRRLRTPPPRQLEWLLGRVVAKDAVRQLLKQRYDLNLCPADVEILPDEEGRPVVRGAWAAQVPHVPLLSISHSAGVAVAVVGDGEAGAGVGVDIEALGRMNADIEELAFAAEERELLSAVQGVEEDEWPLRFWCAKEAVAKALGHGMVGGPRSLVVQALDAASGVLQLGLTGEMARRAGHADGGNGHPDDLVMTAPTAREGHLIVAVCLDRAGVTE